jgi:hypothetical protein
MRRCAASTANSGRFLPALCMELCDVGPGKHVVHAQHVYPEQLRSEAESWAARLRKGMRVTIAAPFAGLHLSVPQADIEIEESTPTPSTEESHA